MKGRFEPKNPRPLKENRKRGRWRATDMKRAVELLLENKISQREAAKQFHIPRSTLRERFEALQRGETVSFSPQVGRFKRTFNDVLEAELVSYVKDLHEMFMPFTKTEFQKFVYKLAEHLKLPHQFKATSQAAGPQFYYTFLARHPDLSARITDSRRMTNPLGFNTYQVTNFFTRYEYLLTKYNFSAYQIHNCDEIRVPVVQNNMQEVFSTQEKEREVLTPSAEERKHVTVLLSINAAGDIYVPPLFTFSSKQQVDEVVKKDAPPGSILEFEDTGWISAKSFKKWLELFVKRTHPTSENPVLLILNGNTYHKDCEVIIYAKENNVYILSFPPETTHKMQPLDQIREPFEIAYIKACSDWTKDHYPAKISSKYIPSIFGVAYCTICRMDWVQSAFKYTGLWPFNPSVFSDADFVPPEHDKEKIDCALTTLSASTERPEPVSMMSVQLVEGSESAPVLPVQSVGSPEVESTLTV